MGQKIKKNKRGQIYLTVVNDWFFYNQQINLSPLKDSVSQSTFGSGLASTIGGALGGLTDSFFDTPSNHRGLFPPGAGSSMLKGGLFGLAGQLASDATYWVMDKTMNCEC